MLDTALKILTLIEEAGFKAYIVGGFVRDHLLGINSHDVDITTNATPQNIKEIFENACLPNDDYGSVTVLYKNIHFEITTYRKEQDYQDNRRPSTITYIDNLKEDLKRRDFTINTICMDKEGTIIDPLNGRKDLADRCLKTVGDPIERFHEDVLRILRAIRFATTLNFTLEEKTREAIIQSKYLLNRLSINRKKEELDKIFASANAIDGLSLIEELSLAEQLSLTNLYKVKPCSQMIGIWTLLEVDDIYPFTRNEKKLMQDIRVCLKQSPLASETLYYYDLYPCLVAGELLSIPKRDITKAYQQLPIHKRSELQITTADILASLQIKPGPILKEVYLYLEKKVLNLQLPNKKQALLNACHQFYSVIR